MVEVARPGVAMSAGPRWGPPGENVERAGMIIRGHGALWGFVNLKSVNGRSHPGEERNLKFKSHPGVPPARLTGLSDSLEKWSFIK